uniref:YhcN/YlaJ family sporulation lipoprotein n=1 Tax=Caldalkalibacillus mannanilyticus TaxID=1418 RepID=UPI0004682467
AGLGMQGAGGMNQGAGFGMQGAGGMNQGAGFGMQGAGGMNRGTGLGTPTDLGARARAGVNNALDAGPYDQNRADDMRRRVMSINGVRDAKVVFHNNAVIVGVDAEGNTNNLVRQVRQQLQGHTRGEQVHVTTDRGMVTRIGDIDNRVRTGQPIRNMANEIGTLMNDLGRTMTAPIRGGAAGTGTRGAGNTGGGVFGTGATR